MALSLAGRHRPDDTGRPHRAGRGHNRRRRTPPERSSALASDLRKPRPSGPSRPTLKARGLGGIRLANSPRRQTGWTVLSPSRPIPASRPLIARAFEAARQRCRSLDEERPRRCLARPFSATTPAGSTLHLTAAVARPSRDESSASRTIAQPAPNSGDNRRNAGRACRKDQGQGTSPEHPWFRQLSLDKSASAVVQCRAPRARHRQI